MPYFEVEHGTKGKLSGPWKRLDQSLRRLALDVMWTMLRVAGEGTRLAAGRAVLGAVGDGEEQGYWSSRRT